MQTSKTPSRSEQPQRLQIQQHQHKQRQQQQLQRTLRRPHPEILPYRLRDQRRPPCPGRQLPHPRGQPDRRDPPVQRAVRKEGRGDHVQRVRVHEPQLREGRERRADGLGRGSVGEAVGGKCGRFHIVLYVHVLDVMRNFMRIVMYCTSIGNVYTKLHFPPFRLGHHDSGYVKKLHTAGQR